MLFIQLASDPDCISTYKCTLQAKNILITTELKGCQLLIFKIIPIISFLALDCDAGWDLVTRSAKGNVAEVQEKKGVKSRK